MNARSIEEVIGWHRLAEDDNGVDEAYHLWVDTSGGIHDRVTVDDLLAWLTGQGYAVKPQTILPGNNITVEVWRGVDCVAVSTDRTLLAALEAAVRAVAGES